MSMPKVYHTLTSLRAKTVEEGDCWIWQGARAWGSQTPMVSHGGKMTLVRRLQLKLQKRKPPAFISTKCGCKLCVNPAHFEFRTVQEQAKVMAHKANEAGTKVLRVAKLAETKRRQVGKITMEQAREIRASDKKCADLAEIYGINQSLAARIRRGESWREFGANPFAGLMGRADAPR